MAIFYCTIDGETKTYELKEIYHEYECHLHNIKFTGKNRIPIDEDGRLRENSSCFFVEKDPTSPKGKNVEIEMTASFLITGTNIPEEMEAKAELFINDQVIAMTNKAPLLLKKESNSPEGEIYAIKKEFTFEAPPMVDAWVHTEDYKNNFDLRIAISHKGKEDWNKVIAATEKYPHLYFTIGAPAKRYEFSELIEVHEPILFFSCKSAKKLTEEQKIVDKIWEKFLVTDAYRGLTTGNLHQKDFGIVNNSKQLGYYTNYNTVNGYKKLLKTCNGDCLAFAELFQASLLILGIECQFRNPSFEKKDVYDGILIKSWHFKGEGTSSNSNFPYMTHFDEKVYNPNYRIMHENGDYWYSKKLPVEVTRDCNSNNNLKGHNNNCPPGNFNNHAFATHNEKWYDPSYGKAFKSLGDWEKASIVGYYRITNETKTINKETVFINRFWEIKKHIQ